MGVLVTANPGGSRARLDQLPEGVWRGLGGFGGSLGGSASLACPGLGRSRTRSEDVSFRGWERVWRGLGGLGQSGGGRLNVPKP